MKTVLEILHGFLALAAPARCPACDAVVGARPAFCEACTPTLERLEGEIGVLDYGGAASEAVTRMKFGGITYGVPALGAFLREGAERFAGHVDVVVPIPVHDVRRRERGFDQTRLLAPYVAQGAGVPERAWLTRVRDTGHQVGRDAAARRSSLRGAFVADAKVAGARVLLVDDVVTTGATLEAAEEALRARGAAEVHAIALCQRLFDRGLVVGADKG